MGIRLSRSGSSLSLLPDRQSNGRTGEHKDSDNDSLDGMSRREDIAQFPYVEFTGRDSITCPTCQGTGRIPSYQVNELVALIPYSDQRLQPQRTKLYVVLSIVLCFLASSLVAFFLFPRSVVVMDDGIHSVTVQFDTTNQKVLMNMTSTLNLSNPNFFSVSVDSVSCQVFYMKTVIGTQQIHNVTTLLPLSDSQNHSENRQHGADIHEQPGGLPLHRLWLQHHRHPAAPPLLHPLTCLKPRHPSAMSPAKRRLTPKEEVGDVGAHSRMVSVQQQQQFQMVLFFF
uniref:Transmembrane protein 106C n=1 Tax=Labrus bergylta TaxID=56723 RepID=A0A3Q3FYX3_9LABR